MDDDNTHTVKNTSFILRKEILELVFEFLNLEDLMRAAKVNEVWYEEANRSMLLKRISPVWFSYGYGLSANRQFFLNSNNLNYNSMSPVHFLMINKLSVRCRIGLIKKFSHYIFVGERMFYNENFPEIDERVRAICASSVHILCNDLFLLLKTDKSQLPMIGRNPSMQTFILPKLKNLRMVWFNYNTPLYETTPTIAKFFEKIKCLLVFSISDVDVNQVQRLINALVLTDNGGLVPGVGSRMTDKNINGDERITRLLFILEDNRMESQFDAFSFRMKGGNLSEQEIGNQLMQFNEIIRLKTHTVAMLIVSNCSPLVPKSVLCAFRRVFPNICLFGMKADSDYNWSNRNVINVEHICSGSNLTHTSNEDACIQILFMTWCGKI